MKLQALPVIALLLLFSLAVSGRSAHAEEKIPTIGTLKIEPTWIDKKPIEGDLQQTTQSYQELVDLLDSLTESKIEIEGGIQPAMLRNILSEARRRLADLKLENDEESQFLETSEGGKQPKLTTNSHALYQRTARIYEAMLLNNPDYIANDGVLYQLAHIYELLGETDKMLAALTQLTKKYDWSHLHTEANFRLAEHYFVSKKYGDAAKAYQVVFSGGKSSPFFDQTLYKLGWSLFKLQDLSGAMKHFILLLDRLLMGARDTTTLDESPRKSLFYDTLHIASFSFAHMGGQKSIHKYFEEKGHRAYEYLVYQHLGEHYERKERFHDSAETYLAFVNLYPAHPHSPALQLKAIETYVKGGFPAQAILEKEAFIERYKFSGPHWKNLPEKERKPLESHLHKNLLDLSEHYHARAQLGLTKESTKKQAEEDFKKALYWYRLYIDAFPDTAETGRINFLMADLLFDFQRYSEAVDEYTKTSYGYPAHEKSAEAGYAALLAYAEKKKSLAQEERQRWQALEIKSALRFSNTYPNDPRRTEVLTKVAEQLFQTAKYKHAMEVAQEVIQQQPTTDLKLLSAKKVYAHSAFELKNFARAEAAYLDLLSLIPKGEKQHQAIAERLAASIYKQGEINRAPGNQLAVAEHFLRVGQLAPNSSIRETADYDAATSYLEAEAWSKASAILDAYIKRYPDSPRLGDIRKKQVLAYLQDGKPLMAAEVYSTIARQDRSTETRREASWSAAEIYLSANQQEQALTALKRHTQQFPEPLEQAVEARQHIADIYQKRQAFKKRDIWLKQIIAIDKKATGSQTVRIHFLAAKASFILADSLFESFSKVQLSVPLKKSLQSKKRKMRAAIDAYNKVAEYQVAKFTTAAGYRTAEIYRLMGQALMDSERPNNLTEEEREQYDILLEEQAYPFEEKAIETHEANITTVAQGIYNQWNKLSFSALAKLQPVRYDKQEKSEKIVHALQ